jgi:uncharacterized protein YbjQ (UPF0145 family)
MQISTTDAIEGRKVVASIGKIEAGSSWHAAGCLPHQGNWREQVLEDLMRRAEDIGADAIIGLGYTEDGVKIATETGIELRRFIASGIAVRLSVAA